MLRRNFLQAMSVVAAMPEINLFEGNEKVIILTKGQYLFQKNNNDPRKNLSIGCCTPFVVEQEINTIETMFTDKVIQIKDRNDKIIYEYRGFIHNNENGHAIKTKIINHDSKIDISLMKVEFGEIICANCY